jgi:predicted transcriptional regulator
MKTTTTIKPCTEEQYIRHSRNIAKLIDQKRDLPEESYILLGDPADLLKLLRANSRTLLRAIQDHPGSINSIAEYLQRKRAAVHRDISELERLGIAVIEKRIVPGVGHDEVVHLTAQKFKLQTDLI